MRDAPSVDMVRVAVDAPLHRALSYAIPEGEATPRRGTRVLVPLGRRRAAGVVLGLDTEPPPKGLRTLLRVLDDQPALPEDVVSLAEFAAAYYRAPLGELLRSALPPGMGSVAGPRVRLTDAGRRLLRVALLADLSSGERWTLEALGKGPRSQRALLDGRGSRSTLSRLQERGLVVVDAVGAPAAPPTRIHFSLRSGADLDDLPPRARAMRAVVEALGQLGSATSSRLEDQVPGARAALRRLERRGVVVRHEGDRPLGALEVLAPDSISHPQLTEAQRTAVDAVTAAIEERRYAPFLLFGVTSSGKTEVYLAAAEQALAHGRGALILVPEIALTPQLVGRFERRLPGSVEVLHSGLPAAERRQRWQRVRRGEALCVVGARSAIFAPLPELGVIVVDEEHEPSYKQEESPRYHARDLALYRGRDLACPVILGSATPSLESYHRAREGALGLLELPERVAGASLPRVEVVPIQRSTGPSAAADPARMEILTPELREAVEQTLARREQAILFLNRRGYANFVLCHDCGQSVGCPNCSVTLTLHQRPGELICHYCGHRARIPDRCDRCEGDRVIPLGVGTERLEDEVRTLFPQARVARLDRDTTRRRGALLRCLERFAAHEMDILLGTQMLAKGHDYPHVTLVGVVLADVGLGLADFRATERTFQLLAQVAGRAGRGERPGRVIVQTFDPENPAIAAARTHDYEGFAARELAERRELLYPPFGRLAVVRIESPDPEAAERVAREILGAAQRRIPADVRLLGPAPAPLARLRGVTRVQALVKAPTARSRQQALTEIEQLHASHPLSSTRLVFDVDPALML